MERSLLEQLSEMTVVVADTGDIHSIEKFKPRDATTNPSLITAAAQMDEYREIVDEALRWAEREAGKGATREAILRFAIDRLAVEFGLRILSIVPGRVSTEVDARLSYDTRGTVEKGRYLIQQYEAAGASRERVLIKIASTWEGIQAAAELEKEGIHCNLTLLFGMHQAIACAEARVTLISPFVGRILDWFKARDKRDYVGDEDPGVRSVSKIYEYYKKFDYHTEIMGASFRNVGEIIELAGCDLLTISPPLLTQLRDTKGPLERKLDPANSNRSGVPKVDVNAGTFAAMHKSDDMAREKLDEGIHGFSKAIVALEKILGERLDALHKSGRAGDAARDFFKCYDLDGDGFITREEWSGTQAVFDALDHNGDGRISPEELAAGLGAAFTLR